MFYLDDKSNKMITKKGPFVTKVGLKKVVNSHIYVSFAITPKLC